MIKTEIQTVGEVECKYTYSTLSVYIANENGQKYASAYDPMNSTHTYTETDELIDIDMSEIQQKEWIDYLKEYQRVFGQEESVYSKYKIVKKCIAENIWSKFKAQIDGTEMKDLFDAALEFSTCDDVFVKGLYLAYDYFHRDIEKAKEFLDECVKD